MINVKKILFVGKFDSIFQNINNLFDNLFSVHICVDSAPMVKGMLKLKKPELVVLSLIRISADADKIFEELRINYSQTPVICIGSDEDANRYNDCISAPQFTKLTMPVDSGNVLNMACNILGITHNGMSLLGDGKYGSRDNSATLALWASKLEIVHPVTNKKISVESCPPDIYPWTLF